jgi:hypothetical protein
MNCPATRYPNAGCCEKALRDIRAGDVLVAHLGIWSRQDAWAPAVLEPLIQGLKARGLCFATLREHPHVPRCALNLAMTLSTLWRRPAVALRAAGAAPDVRLGPGQPAGRRLRATGWLLVGLLQIAFMLVVFGALQRWRPVEAVTDRGRARGRDLHAHPPPGPVSRGAVLHAGAAVGHLVGQLRVAGLPAWSVDQIWPGVTDQALVSFRDLPGAVRRRQLRAAPTRSTASTGGGSCMRCTTASAR